MRNITFLFSCFLFLSHGLIGQAPNASVRIAEAEGAGCNNLSDCENDLICFDVYFKVDQPNWSLQSYNIWMDYGPNNNVLTFSSEDPCHHTQGGAINLDMFGKYRYLAALSGLPLNQNEEVIIHNFCLTIKELQALDNFDITAGGDHFGLLSSVNLVDQNNFNNAVNPIVPASTLTLTSETLSCIIAEPKPTIRIVESNGDGCNNITDCDNDIVCFDVYFKVDQPNWNLQSYNIWMDYGDDNSILSFSTEDPCHHQQGGGVNLDDLGKYRFLGAQFGLPLNENEEVIIQNFCLNIEDLPALQGYVISGGGDHFGLLSSVNLVDQNNMNNAVNPIVPSTSLTLNSASFSCLDLTTIVTIQEATGQGCHEVTDCEAGQICFDVIMEVDQANWALQSYNIWMDYGPNNSVFSFSSERPCYSLQQGAINLDFLGKYRFAAAGVSVPLIQGQGTIIHNFCLDIKDYNAMDGFDITVGGVHWNLVSSATLTDQEDLSDAINQFLPPYTLNLNSETLSCLQTSYRSASKELPLDIESTFDSRSSITMKVFPNPVVNEMIISFTNPSQQSHLFIYDLNGRMIKSIPQVQSGQAIDVSQLNNGVYLIRSAEENAQPIKFIKN